MALSQGSWSPTSGMKENWLVQVYETDASGFKAFSFYDQTVNSVAYSGIILNNPSIRESINIFKSSSSISNLSIELQDDSNLRQDLLFGSNYYLNGDVKIFSNLDTSSSVANFNNIPQIYQGRLESVQHNDTTITLNIVAKRPYDNVTVPNVFSAEKVPSPLAYGNFSDTAGDRTATTKLNGTPNFFRKVPFTKYDTTGISFITGTTGEDEDENIYTYLSNYDAFIHYSAGETENSTAGNVKVNKMPVSGKYIYQVPPVSTTSSTTSTEIALANVANSFDNNDATEATFTFPVGGVSNGTYTHKERYTLDDEIEEGQQARAFFDVSSYSDLPEAHVKLYLLDADNANVGTGSEQIFTGNVSNRTATVTATGNAKKIEVEVQFQYSSGSSPSAVVELKEVFAYLTKFEDEIEFGFLGYSGEPRGYKSSTTRVDKIHEAHRSFVHSILGVDTDGAGSADPTGWSDLDTDRSSWTIRYNQLEPLPAKKILDKMQFEGGFISVFEADGDVRYIHVKNSYSSANHTLDKNDLANIQYTHTPISNIITDILVNYDPHPAKRRLYRNQQTASESTIRSNYNIATAQVVTVNLDMLSGGIGSDLTPSTANAGFIDYYGNLRSAPRVIMTAEVVNPAKFNMEIGDICTFSSMLPATAFNKSFSGAYFMITSISRTLGRIQAQFTEVT